LPPFSVAQYNREADTVRTCSTYDNTQTEWTK